MKRLFAFFLFFVILISAVSISASAAVTIEDKNGETIDMTELFQAKTFTSSKGTKINYRIFFPKDYSTKKTYPLVLFLHGLGQRGSDNESQLKLGICEPFKDPNSPIYDCIVLAPQCPGDDLWVETDQMWDVYCSYDSTKVPESPSLAAVAELVQKTRDENAVNKNRVYVTGISMGGFGTWDLLVRHTRIFAAAMPLCGGADYRRAGLLRNVPIWTFHGMKDTVVPPAGTIKMAEKLSEIGGNIIFDENEYPNHGHNIWEDVYKRTDILPWLLSQKANYFAEETTSPEEPEKTTDAQPEAKKSSCRSAAGGIAPAILIASTAALALGKKKKKEQQ